MKTDFYEAAQKFLLKPDSVNSMRAVALLATFNCLRPVNLPKMQSTLLLLLFIAILLPNISHGPKPESDELLNTSVGKKPAFDWLKSLWAKQKGEPALEILPFLHIKRNQKWHTALKRETAGISEVVDRVEPGAFIRRATKWNHLPLPVKIIWHHGAWRHNLWWKEIKSNEYTGAGKVCEV